MPEAQANGRDGIAIIGFSGRFPGARDVDEFWDNLKNGRESLRSFADEREPPGGPDAEPIGDAKVVRKAMALEGIELFDATFFGYTSAQACRVDPQQRVFLEVAWHALEHAGYDVERYPGVVGIFAGVSRSTYGGVADKDPGDIQAAIDHGLGSIANRVSYKLNLDGPSVCVDTACSTSLVAVHLASQSLLSHDCDMALAGGASIRLPQNGYVYHKNSILSPDGHCRAYDADARGTVPGNGVGIVVMKRLTDALADRDRIYAVILGSATNNDGGHKVGYTAPSLEAQISVMESALARAGVMPRSIGMIEGHGTGTVVGDEIELTALTEVMASDCGVRSGKCALGAVKANIGHLDVAAGVTGLIKTVLCISEKTLVPTINCTLPSPLLRKADSPFYINSMLRKWEATEGPRRAGVSSFGIGGSNAHVVLEEREAPPRPARKVNEPLIFSLSARTARALNLARTELRRYLILHRELTMEDVAFTLQMGRACFGHRFCAVAASRERLLGALADDFGVRGEPDGEAVEDKSLVLQFSGDDSREFASLQALYGTEPAFAAIVTSCLESVAPFTSVTRDVLLNGVTDPLTLGQLRERQLARLLREYCLAQLWLKYGVEPSGVIGFGSGKLAAACIAGVMSIEAACRLCVAATGPEEDGVEVARILSAQNVAEIAECSWLGVSVWRAQQHGMSEIVGSPRSAAAVCRSLDSRGIGYSRLHENCESGLNGAEDRLLECVERIALSAPEIPYVSVADGQPITADQAKSAQYWRQEIELGPAACPGKPMESADIALLVEPRPKLSWEREARPAAARKVHGHVLESHQAVDRHSLLSLLAAVWQEGAALDWNGLCLSPDGNRVALPVYPFERMRHWLDMLETTPTGLPSAPGTRVDVEGRDDPRARRETPCQPPRDGRDNEDQTPKRASELTASAGTDLESVVAGIWAEVLELSSIKLDDRFLDIGGDSLVGIRVAEHIESMFGVDLPLDEFIRSDTTVRKMARLISDRLPSMADQGNG